MEWRPMNLGALLPWHGRRLWLGALPMEGAGLMAELVPERGPGPCLQSPGFPVSPPTSHTHSALTQAVLHCSLTDAQGGV